MQKVVPIAARANADSEDSAPEPAEVDLKRLKAPLKRDREARLKSMVIVFAFEKENESVASKFLE